MANGENREGRGFSVVVVTPSERRPVLVSQNGVEELGLPGAERKIHGFDTQQLVEGDKFMHNDISYTFVSRNIDRGFNAIDATGKKVVLNTSKVTKIIAKQVKHDL